MNDQLRRTVTGVTVNRSNAEYKRKKKKWLADRIRWNGMWVCSSCGFWTVEPELDHIKRTGMGGSPERLLDEENWQLLCRLCHEKKDGGFR